MNTFDVNCIQILTDPAKQNKLLQTSSDILKYTIKNILHDDNMISLATEQPLRIVKLQT